MNDTDTDGAPDMINNGIDDPEDKDDMATIQVALDTGGSVHCASNARRTPLANAS